MKKIHVQHGDQWKSYLENNQVKNVLGLFDVYSSASNHICTEINEDMGKIGSIRMSASIVVPAHTAISICGTARN